MNKLIFIKYKIIFFNNFDLFNKFYSKLFIMSDYYILLKMNYYKLLNIISNYNENNIV